MFCRFTHLSILASLAISCAASQRAAAQSAELASAPASSSSSTAKPQANSGEDWAKLTVDRAVLKPLLPGVSLGKADTPAFTRELVRLEWRHGDFIDLYVVKPHAVQKPRVVLYLYSFPSDTDRFMNDGWCSRVTHEGLAAVGFVSALTGERFRNRPMKEWFVSELQESLGSSAHDVQLILDYLASRGDLSASQVGIFGQGSGASIAILAAAADPRITALDLLNPWGDWPDWLKTSPVVPDEEREKYLTGKFLGKASKVDPVEFLPSLTDRAMRVQQVMDDPDTPAEAKKRIDAAVPPGHLVQFKDTAEHREAWKAAGISGWIAAQLLPPPQRASSTVGLNAK